MCFKILRGWNLERILAPGTRSPYHVTGQVEQRATGWHPEPEATAESRPEQTVSGTSRAGELAAPHNAPPGQASWAQHWFKQTPWCA